MGQAASAIGPSSAEHPTLPLEIQERILDFVASDSEPLSKIQRTLVACSLTCRVWVPSTRYHLFKTVSLCDPSLRTFEKFARILRASPRLGGYVRALDLDITWNDEDRGARLFSSVARGLGRVQVLRLTGSSHRKLSVDSIEFSHLGPVTDLTLNLTVPDVADLATLFRALPLIENLHFLSVGFGEFNSTPTGDEVAGLLPSLPVLRSLKVNGFLMDHWMLPKLFSNPIPTLESLSATLFLPDHVITLAHLLRVLGREVKHLAISFVHVCRDDGPDPNMALLAGAVSACPSLRSAHFSCPFLVPWVPRFLAMIEFSQIEELTLDAYIPESYAHLTDFDPFLLPFAHAQYRHVSRITIALRVSPYIRLPVLSAEQARSAVAYHLAAIRDKVDLSVVRVVPKPNGNVIY